MDYPMLSDANLFAALDAEIELLPAKERPIRREIAKLLRSISGSIVEIKHGWKECNSITQPIIDSRVEFERAAKERNNG
jgi:hypothetical protein